MKKQIYYLVASCYTLDVPEIPAKAVNAIKSMCYSVVYATAEINALVYEDEAHERINVCRQRVKDFVKTIEDEENCKVEIIDSTQRFTVLVNGISIIDIDEAKVHN
ncbi:MAG: hypothetical protein EKK63_01715 [Acinetobacter sp.]|uniref:hypothetical protein n=1 Tax=Acinetobacter sp. TaxID=472 RepID=UPI000FA7318C|nr:hypothetical protein [Acinetobacter sp.]RUP42322.1 MAG: hypothetical protein EKK63_01715 [Acinetobacter sp.]